MFPEKLRKFYFMGIESWQFKCHACSDKSVISEIIFYYEDSEQ